ncbi:hypothetical protein DSCO28_65800 [Desulfosarcina ovata subsp. sediminis]|uniref:Uncharacterized protein n=2 Tax=Desulfosarcina ovata TaxID=83564 RepID=A0A5K8A0U9_9BACT|nr:hypothetical protein DSCO28_65800 [Desulfosarcina ovata subsp. sediminis]
MLDIIDKGRRVRIYTQMNDIGDPKNNQLLFPAKVASKLNLTTKQMHRRLIDLLLRVKRFEVYDPDYTVVQDKAYQQWGPEEADIRIDCLVTDARQKVIDIRPYRKVRTQVKVSLHMVNVLTGAILFDSDVAVEGVWGDVQGQGTLIPPNVPLESESVQTSLGGDYERALTKAFDAAVERIDQIMRPVGRVTFVAGNSISMFGGIQHGFQGGDEIVVFRAHRKDMGDGYERLIGVQPIARARCDGVGSDLSQCTVLRIEPSQQPMDGDYAVLTDESARGMRNR